MDIVNIANRLVQLENIDAEGKRLDVVMRTPEIPNMMLSI